jgi:uncharacterized repeat protein (TIGR02543 family)
MSAAVVCVALTTACPDSSAPPDVASVQMSTTYSNPRVGETSNVTAKAVNDGGVEIQGVPCAFSSTVPAVATVGAATGVVTALSVGTTSIVATCGGKSNSITITVRPKQFTLTINKTGTGNGAVFNTPAGTTFDDGTSVSITATANQGSTFAGWSGACAGTAQPCEITMDADQTVTASFSLGENFILSLPFGGNMTSVSDPSPPGCTYSVSINVSSFDLVAGPTSAAGTVESSISVTPSGQSGVGTCSGHPFDVTATGNLTVSGNSITGTLVFFSQTKQKNTETLTISATRDGSSINGSMTVNQKLYNGAEDEFTSTGGPFNFLLSKTP